ncbi:DUF4227 family protein [Paenibacillus sp. y28]|uniref:DUF4227 family protein n=1 Tax=Paenibacillus sp. y28 TaxID=3129110 RepID=UPI00301ACFCA
MIFSVRKWWMRGKFVFMLLLLSFLLYHLFQFVSSWVEPMQRYKEPSGRAVKAFEPDGEPARPETVLDRLILFYWIGE